MNTVVQNWWRNLALRERRVIAWGAGALLLALAYAYLWQPLEAERTKLKAGLPALRTAAAEVKAEAEEAVRLKSLGSSPVTGAALQAAVRQAANDAGNGKTLQLGMLDDTRVNAAWPAISFDAWTGMLTALQAGQHVRLESATVEALPATGMVRVQAVFSAGG